MNNLNIGRRVYYEKLTGEVFLSIGERVGAVIPTTIEQDIETYKFLSERNRESFGVIDLGFGQHAQDFAESNGYRVNPETEELEFSYPDPNEEEPQEPVYQKPLSEQIKEQEQAIGELTTLVSMISGGGM